MTPTPSPLLNIAEYMNIRVCMLNIGQGIASKLFVTNHARTAASSNADFH